MQKDSSPASIHPSGIFSIIKVVATTISFIVLLDIGINLAFEMPADPRIKPTRLQQYFDYGRSIEGKLRYMVRDTDEASGPIVRSGWIHDQPSDPEDHARGNGKLVAIYGQSMSHRVGHQIEALDESIRLRLRGGPAAPLSHSYELFRLDRGKHEADVAVIGVVASGLRALTTLTTMGWAFEVPAPYTYHRWKIEDGELQSIQPTIQSLADLRRALNEPAEWQRFTDQLREHDLSYSSVLFNSGPSDYSATMRLVKRGLGQRHQNSIVARYTDGDTFRDTDAIVTIARALLTRFAVEARQDGAMPLVLLFHDRGTGDSLYRAVSDTLFQSDVPFVSTHDIAPANEASSFLPDGHFQRKYDIEFARAALERIQSRRDSKHVQRQDERTRGNFEARRVTRE